MQPNGFFLREHSSIMMAILRLTDWTVLVVSGLFALELVNPSHARLEYYYVAISVAFALSVVIFPLSSMYQTWRGYSRAQEIRTIILAWSSVFFGLTFIAFATKVSEDFSRAWTFAWYGLGLLILIVGRLAARSGLNYLRSLGFNRRHIVVIGSGVVGNQVVEKLREAKDSGFNIIGYFTNDKTVPVFDSDPVVGKIKDAFSFIERDQVDQIWLAMPLTKVRQIRVILNSLKDTTADIRLVPDIFGFRLINHSVSDIAGLPVVNLSVTPMEGLNRYLKAIEDKMLATCILLMISPLMLILALGVKLSSPGPIFYRQERVSWNGKSFYMYKFRSMPIDAETESGPVWAKAGEDRATRFGSFLRRTSLDELPQFWNVLKGDMSIVGPRPERPVFVEKFKDEIPGYMQKHKVKAGITGWAQVNGWRGDTDLNQRIEHDLHYIENWSLWLDIKIIFLTVFKGFINRNAY